MVAVGAAVGAVVEVGTPVGEGVWIGVSTVFWRCEFLKLSFKRFWFFLLVGYEGVFFLL